jgi:hypothetical protein
MSTGPNVTCVSACVYSWSVSLATAVDDLAPVHRLRSELFLDGLGEYLDGRNRCTEVMHQNGGEILQLFLLLRHLPLQRRPLHADSYAAPNRLGIHMLFDKIVGSTTLHGLGRDPFVAVTGRHDDGHIRKALMQGGDALQAVETRHPIVDNCAIERALVASRKSFIDAHGLDARARKRGLLQAAFDLSAVALVVVRDEDIQSVERHETTSCLNLNQGSSTMRQ